MKILQPMFGILVALMKNEVTKICNEPGKYLVKSQGVRKMRNHKGYDYTVKSSQQYSLILQCVFLFFIDLNPNLSSAQSKLKLRICHCLSHHHVGTRDLNEQYRRRQAGGHSITTCTRKGRQVVSIKSTLGHVNKRQLKRIPQLSPLDGGRWSKLGVIWSTQLLNDLQAKKTDYGGVGCAWI